MRGEPLPPAVRLGQVAVRLGQVALFTAGTLVWIAMISVLSSPSARGHRVAGAVARLAERLRGAFLKGGQLLGTRADLIGPALAAALSRLHDDVEAMSGGNALRAAEEAFDRVPREVAQAVRRPPVASGSIACVYRAELDHGALAIKIRRPGIAHRITADIAIARLLARVLGRFAVFRRVPLDDMVEQIGASLIGQLDFAAEADNLARLRDDLADVPGVVVPAVVPELCGDGVIAMEFVEGLDRTAVDRLPSATRETAVARLVGAVYHMLFMSGFIHVDLHQGNVYFRTDGTVVILDAGFAFQMSDMAATKFTRFFAGMIRGDGESCADILLSTVRGADAHADAGEFRQSVADLVTRNAGVVARDFSLSSFSVELFDLQRRHRLFAEPEFVFPLLCLLALEGTVKAHHPLMDFQLQAAPHVMHGLLQRAE